MDEADKLALKTYEIYSQYFTTLIGISEKLAPQKRAEFVIRKVEKLESGAVSLAAR